MASAPGKGKSRAASFAARLLSTVCLWGVVLLVLYSGRLWAVASLGVAFGILGSIEFYRLTRGLPGRDCRILALVVSLLFLGSLLALVMAGKLGVDWFLPEAAALVVVLLGGFSVRLRHEPQGPESVYPVAIGLLALLYVPILFASFMVRLALTPPPPVPAGLYDPERAGLWLVLLVIATAKFTDMGAYLVGTLIGRHKAIPHVSPGKSWEGYLGSLLFAQAGAIGMFFLGGDHFAWLGSLGHVVALGFLIALAAMVGDLAESILKRSLKVKDSGNMLPGIGGVLDLIDSLGFAAPVAFFYLYLVLEVF